MGRRQPRYLVIEVDYRGRKRKEGRKEGGENGGKADEGGGQRRGTEAAICK
jgi:hypothetical protein